MTSQLKSIRLPFDYGYSDAFARFLVEGMIDWRLELRNAIHDGEETDFGTRTVKQVCAAFERTIAGSQGIL